MWPRYGGTLDVEEYEGRLVGELFTLYQKDYEGKIVETILQIDD